MLHLLVSLVQNAIAFSMVINVNALKEEKVNVVDTDITVKISVVVLVASVWRLSMDLYANVTKVTKVLTVNLMSTNVWSRPANVLSTLIVSTP